MHRVIVAVFALVFTLGVAGVADAKQCRDAKGHFVKCKPLPPPMQMQMQMAKKPCRDAKGHFVKCKR